MGRHISCLKHFDTFARIIIRESKINAVARPPLIFQILIYQTYINYTRAIAIDHQKHRCNYSFPIYLIIGANAEKEIS